MGAEGLQVLVLGDVTILAEGRPVPVPGSRKTRALLAYLLLQNRPVTREHLCELLWPHPDNPRAALRWSLSKLRPVLNRDAQHLVADRATVAIEGLADRVDIRQVDDLLKKPLEKIETADLETAAGLFGGELLEGMEIPDCHRFNEWLIARCEAARKSRRTILETLTARHADHPERALVHARARVALDPLDEGAHIDVVRLLGALGRIAEARDQASRCREILEVELGAAPGPGLADALDGMKKSVHPSPAVPEAALPVHPTADAGLFGRSEECIRLESFLADGDRRRILFFEGEPGIGKSRLLAELRRRAEARGLLVLTGRSWEVEMVRPFGVWIDLLEGVPPEKVPAGLRGDLALLMPSLGAAAPGNGSRERLFRAVEKLLQTLLWEVRPVLLLFDDIHWIDPASAELLGHLSCRMADLSPGWACAGRPGEFADNEPARALLRGWNRSGRLDRMGVSPLADRDAAALARAMSPSTDVERIVATCGGNPLYLIESSRGGAGETSGRVRSLVADRLAALDEPTGDIARWAAVLGHAFPASRLADLLSQPLDDLLSRTETLERHGILRPHGEEWDFAHDLLRRAALAELSGPRRSLMHRRIARAMSAEPDPDHALAGEIAFHAARGGEPETAARYSVAAGDKALRMAAFEDAWRIAERGLAALGKLAEETTTELRVELLRVKVLASRGRGQGEEIAEQLNQLAVRAHTAGLPTAERTARWLLSIVAEEAGDFDAARRHSLGAEKASRTADAPTRLRALANTARCLVQLERDPVRAGELLAQARDMAAEARASVLDIPWGLGLLRSIEGRNEEARAALETGAAMARDQENHWARFECLSRLSMLDLAEGNPAGIEARDGILRAVAGKLGEGSEKALADTLLALGRRQEGKEDDGLDTALAELRAADSKGLLAYALNEAGRLALAAGDPASASGCADEALAASGEVGRNHQHDRAMLLKARAAFLEDDLETAAGFVQQLEARLSDLGPDYPIQRDLRVLREDLTRRKAD